MYLVSQWVEKENAKSVLVKMNKSFVVGKFNLPTTNIMKEKLQNYI